MKDKKGNEMDKQLILSLNSRIMWNLDERSVNGGIWKETMWKEQI